MQTWGVANFYRHAAALSPVAVFVYNKPLVVSDVFASTPYTGNGSTQTVTTGVNISTPGGLIIQKSRSLSASWFWTDTVRGNTKQLSSNDTTAEATSSNFVTSFGTTGFGVGSDASINTNLATYASYAIGQAARFFSCIVYSGDGTASHALPNALGITPGLIVVKRTDLDDGIQWAAFHISFSAGQRIFLSTSGGVATNANYFTSTLPNGSTFNVGSNINQAGGTYVAYLFAHDSDTTNGIIQCGTFATDGSGAATVTLGWRPQFLLAKRTDSAGDWIVLDTARGWGAGVDALLLMDTAAAESTATNYGAPSGTGFTVANFDASASYCYMVIKA